MNTAEQLKSFHGDDICALMDEAAAKGDVTQDWDSESTEYDFLDGSVLIVCCGFVTTYGSR